MPFATLLDVWVWFLATVLVVLLTRIAWFRATGRLSQPMEWSAAERQLGTTAAWGLPPPR